MVQVDILYEFPCIELPLRIEEDKTEVEERKERSRDSSKKVLKFRIIL